MRKFVSLLFSLVICGSLISFAAAAEVGDTSITDEKGYTYMLSHAILGTTTFTFYDDLEVPVDHTVTVYLVPKETVVTLPTVNDSFLARWYAPNENARGGWDYFAESGLIVSGTEVPFDIETKKADGTVSHASDKKDAILRLYSVYGFRSIYVKGVDAQNENTSTVTAGMSNFKSTEKYSGFSDVPNNAWYEDNIRQACELGLMNGKGSGKFDPSGTLTLAEAITVASRIKSIYQGNEFSSGGNPWYSNAVAYGIEHGIITEGEFLNFTELATRADFARILYKSIPSQEFDQINQIDKIPDVILGSNNSEIIYELYRAGVLTGGNDSSFNPNNSITRAEAATIINRIVLKENRVVRSMPADVDKEVISNTNKQFTIKVPRDVDWVIKRDDTTDAGLSYFYYQSKTGCAVLRVIVFPKDNITNTSTFSLTTNFRNDCEKKGASISEKGIYESYIAGFTGDGFDYTLINDKGTTWTGQITLFEIPNYIYYVQRETSENCTVEESKYLIEIANSLTPVQ